MIAVALLTWFFRRTLLVERDQPGENLGPGKPFRPAIGAHHRGIEMRGVANVSRKVPRLPSPMRDLTDRHAERSGFIREGVKRKAYHRHGEWVDGVLFGLVREDLAERLD